MLPLDFHRFFWTVFPPFLSPAKNHPFLSLCLYRPLFSFFGFTFLKYFSSFLKWLILWRVSIQTLTICLLFLSFYFYRPFFFLSGFIFLKYFFTFLKIAIFAAGQYTDLFFFRKPVRTAPECVSGQYTVMFVVSIL